MRKRGYYWIIFDYKKLNADARAAGMSAPAEDVPIHWEVGSWDPKVQMWELIGSREPWYEQQIAQVGPKIEPPDLKIIELTKQQKVKR